MAEAKGMTTKELVAYLTVNLNNPTKLFEVGMNKTDAMTYQRMYPGLVPSR